MTFATRMASGTAIGAAMLIGLSAPSAQAGYVVTLTQEGGDVVATGMGLIDLTGLSFVVGGGGGPADGAIPVQAREWRARSRHPMGPKLAP